MTAKLKDIAFVTSNQGKLAEAEAILGIKLKRIDLDQPEIQSVSVEEVVKDKVQRAYDAVRKPVIVEDTGVYVAQWNGFPGALIRSMLKAVGPAGICQMLQGERNAYALTAVGYHDGTQAHIFTGRIDGSIAEKPRGTMGFGWDIIFQPVGYDITFGEMARKEKNEISMRKIAFSKLAEYLAKH